MTQGECPSCRKAVPEAGQSCPDCGAPAHDAFPDLTRTSAPLEPENSPPGKERRAGVATTHRPGTHSSEVSDEGRFVAGTILDGRYRIVNLVGRGGMGEVYRAEDLRLAQTVALKFLPEAVAERTGLLARFHNEVRLARQITHPNVCRVHDIGEADGQHFLSMEFVDGEDLASLLRRIGRLPREKGVEIARQLCAGLAAAHEKGILHRDLKPANVMLDGRGRVRIMDFGLASIAETVAGPEAASGTPAYMAPEQLSGKGVSAQSDIYALGLVLYEIFTGRPAFEPGRTPADLLRLRETATPASLASVVPGLDESIERVVLRCLERDPQRRPASAVAVAAALPGGDPLAAAVAAGETPSPELVAAAGEEGGLRPAVAWSLLVAILAGSLILSVTMARRGIMEWVPLDKSPEVLADKAVEIVHRLGYTDPPTDSVSALAVEGQYLTWVGRTDDSAHRWDALATGRPTVVELIYRQSPEPLIPSRIDGLVTDIDPPLVTAGMISTYLDTLGRLFIFVAIPPAVDESSAPAPEPDWSVAFDAAGLDFSRFTPVAPTWLPYSYADRRASWEGSFPEGPDTRITVQAAAYRGRLVYFEIVGPWSLDWRMLSFNRPPPSLTEKAIQVGAIVLLLSVLVGAGLLTWRNLRLERADRKGAVRLAALVFCSSLVVSAMFSHHIAGLQELQVLSKNLGSGLLSAMAAWLFYMALEPLVRRRWPQSLISWSRLLAGRFRDPAIGRDLLIGGCVAVAMRLIAQGTVVTEGVFGVPPAQPVLGGFSFLPQGLRLYVGLLFQPVWFATLLSTFLLLGLTVLRITLRRQSLVVVAFLLLFCVSGVSGDRTIAQNLPGLIGGGLTGALMLGTLTRFGLLATMAAWYMVSCMPLYPVSTGLTHWHADRFLFGMTVITTLAIYGFITALAGRSPFGKGLLQE